VRFRKELCLVLPHIEEDGLFCHGVEPAPQDYDAPVEAAKAVLERLKEFWADSADPAWVKSEFQRECLSYWSRFVAKYKPVRGVQAAYDVRVALAPLDGPTKGRFAAYFKKGKKSRSERLVAVVGDADPNGLAVRHGWSVGTVIRGVALFVPLDQQHPWGPDAWPSSWRC
jgi:sulfur-carrier protein adenylyltransferase/sulfurtransferase